MEVDHSFEFCRFIGLVFGNGDHLLLTALKVSVFPRQRPRAFSGVACTPHGTDAYDEDIIIYPDSLKGREKFLAFSGFGGFW